MSKCFRYRKKRVKTLFLNSDFLQCLEHSRVGFLLFCNVQLFRIEYM